MVRALHGESTDHVEMVIRNPEPRALLVPAGEPVVVAIDDTLFRRRGKKVWAASWFHDGAAPGPARSSGRRFV